MLVTWIVGIYKPFLYLVMTAYLHRRQLAYHTHQRVFVSLVAAKLTCGKKCGIKSVEGYLVVHRATGHNACARLVVTMFRRHGRHGDEPSGLRVFHQIAHIEVGSAAKGIVMTAKKVFVCREEIVLPEMLGKPCASIGPHAVICLVDRTGHTPDVGIVMGSPATGSIEF